MARPYHKNKYRNNNKVILFCIITALVVFALTIIFYPQISPQTNKIQNSEEAIINTISTSTKEYVSGITTKDDPQSISLQIHDLVNQARKEHGLTAYSWDDKLAGIAQQHSDEMAQSGEYGHNGLDERLSSINCQNGGENVGISNGYRLDQVPQITINGWLNSYEHRNNLLSSNFNYEGIGITTDGSKTLITEDFC